MAETNNQGETPENEETVETTGTATQAETRTVEQLRADVEQLRKKLKDVNGESAGRRKRLDELEAAETKRKQAELTETERLAQAAKDFEEKLHAAQSQLNTERIGNAVEKAARDAGFEYPEDAVKLIDPSDIEIDEGGKIKGVKQAVDALVKSRPALVKAAAAHPAPPRPFNGNSPPPRPAASEDPIRSEVLKHGNYQPL